MRTYAIVHGTFWTGKTGRAIRKEGGLAAQLLALHLITSTHSNFGGLYYLPLLYAANETGLTTDQLREFFGLFEKLEFAKYDEEYEIVFVLNAPLYQTGKKGLQQMKEKDNKVKARQSEYDAVPNECPLKREFFEKYGRIFCLIDEMMTAAPQPAKATPTLAPAQAPILTAALQEAPALPKAAAEPKVNAQSQFDRQLQRLLDNVSQHAPEVAAQGLWRLTSIVMLFQRQFGLEAATQQLLFVFATGDYALDLMISKLRERDDGQDNMELIELYGSIDAFFKAAGVSEADPQGAGLMEAIERYIRRTSVSDASLALQNSIKSKDYALANMAATVKHVKAAEYAGACEAGNRFLEADDDDI
jgi:hypothetical protein